MSIGRILTPVAGACIGIEWYRIQSCPQRLALTTDADYLAVDFAGRGKVGLSCGGSDTYVSTVSAKVCNVNVWTAYRDGIWSSSVTIDVYISSSPIIQTNRSINANPAGSSALVTKSGITTAVAFCPSSILATVTVNDDGTYSIA